MAWMLLISLLAPPASSAAVAADDGWMQEARDWLVACRVANERLSPEAVKALTASIDKLTPAALRVLVTVYEQRYRVASPLSAKDRVPPDATEAEREWIIAYRIVYEHLTVEQAKQYAETLKAMSPTQIRALTNVYAEKDRLRLQRQAQSSSYSSPGDSSTAHPMPDPTTHEENVRNLHAAQQRMQFEQEARQMALGRAGSARTQTNQALVAANAAAAPAAAAENQRLAEMQQFTNAQVMQHNDFMNRMYERSTAPNPYNNNYYRLW
jgi:hypothetical protein